MQQIEHYIAENGLLMISRAIGMGILISMSVTDLKYRKVSGAMLMSASVLAAGYVLVFGRDQIWMNLGGLFAGAFFLLVSKVTKEGLGYGDSWLICILGFYLGTWELMELLMIAWTGAALTAMIVLMRKRYNRKAVLPMVPFITGGYVTVWAAEVLGR